MTRSRPVTLLATVLLAAGASTVCPAAAGAAASAGQQPAPSLVLVDQTTWLHAGDQFSVTVQAPGAAADARLQLVVHDRLISRAAYQRTLAGELGDVALTLDPQPLLALGGAEPNHTTGFPVGRGGHGLDGPGVYPVDVRLIDGQGNPLASLLTHLIYLPNRAGTTAFTPLSVAVVVELGAAPALRPDGTYHVAADTIERARERLALLSGSQDVPLTFAPQPETLDGLAADDGPAAALVESLAGAIGSRPVLARPYAEVDLAALRDSGLIVEANHQAQAGADVVRDRFGREPVPRIWMSGPTLGPDAARIAVELGIDRALLPPSAVAAAPSAAAGPVPDAPVSVNGGGPLAMVSDPDLAARLGGDGGALDAHRFLAELSIMWFERPAIPRAVAVHLAGHAPLDPDTVIRALAGLADGQAVRAVPLAQVFTDVPPDPEGPTAVDAAPHEISADLGSIAGPLTRARRAVSGVASTVDDTPEAGSLAASLLLATSSATPNGQRPAYVDRVTRQLDMLTDVVDLPDEFRITLTSRSSTIPVNVTNRSDRPLTVRIELASSQLEFPEGEVITQQLQPGVTRIDVPVRSRTSGAFPLGVRVTSPDGTLVLDESTFDIRSTAVTGVGLLLSIGAGLFLAVWWARHWRSSRRSRHLVPAGPAAPTPAATMGAADDDIHRPAHMAGARARRE
jgi:hypothetical protein